MEMAAIYDADEPAKSEYEIDTRTFTVSPISCNVVGWIAQWRIVNGEALRMLGA
jgi:hypothetical protein